METSGRAGNLFEFALLILLGILWGVPFALTKISLTTIPPLTLVAARVSIAAVTLWMIIALSGYKIPNSRGWIGRLFAQGIITCALPYTFIAYGQQSVDSALAAILNSTAPLFVCLISVIWTRQEPVTRERLVGVTVGLSGVVLIAGSRHARDELAADWIGHGHENNRNGSCGLHQRFDNRGALPEKTVRVEFDKLLGDRLHAFDVAAGEPVFDAKVLADGPAFLFKTFFESLGAGLSVGISREPHQHANGARADPLLRNRWIWPDQHGTAEEVQKRPAAEKRWLHIAAPRTQIIGARRSNA